MSPLIAAASAVADPPVPNRSTRIAPPSAAVKAKDNLNMGIMAVVAGLIAAVCFGTGHSLPGYLLGILAAIFLVSIFTKKTDVGQCPYCLAEFRETVSVKDHLLRCDQCGEYSQVTNKVVKPLDPVTYSNTPKFESAVFKQGSMPNACAACGAPATRLDTVATSSMNKSLAAVGAVRLMTGAPGLAIFSSTQASISIPYCDQHREAVGLSFDWRKRPVLSWSSLRMLRRYLAVNRGKEKY